MEGRIHIHHHSLGQEAQGEACILVRIRRGRSKFGDGLTLHRHRNRRSCWAVVLGEDLLGAHNLLEGQKEGRSLVVGSLADSSADSLSYRHNHHQGDLGEVHKGLEIRNPPH